MTSTFEAVGYHGTDKKYVTSILTSINFAYNKGDKFLGQGIYLWRDSYDRACKWANKTKNFNNLSVIAFKIKCSKQNTLNFTSKSWNNEGELLELWKNNFSNLAFGEFLDEMIYNNDMSINLIIIIDLTDKLKTFYIDDNGSRTNFALGDIQICLKNNNPIIMYGEI